MSVAQGSFQKLHPLKLKRLHCDKNVCVCTNVRVCGVRNVLLKAP